MVFTVLAVFVTGPSVYAYIDPATGSYVLQIVVAGLAGSLYVVKTFWGNIRGALPRIFSTRRQRSEK